MLDHVMLTNWRRFPRARVSCDVVYGDRFQSWRSHTRDISLGGCRVVGYYPFPLGKALALKLTHPGIAEPVSVAGKVVRLYGGAENALGVVFEGDDRSRANLERWIRKVLANEPEAERTLSRMPGQLPIEAQLRRASFRLPTRPLSAGEKAVLDRLDKSRGGISLQQLRTEWGADWERRAQVIFDLIAEGIVEYAVQEPRPRSVVRKSIAEESACISTQRLMQQLENEYGPIDQRFAQEVNTITKEVIRWGSDGIKDQAPTPSHSGPKSPIAISWVATPVKKR